MAMIANRTTVVVGTALVVAAVVVASATASTGKNPHPIHPQISWTASRQIQSGTGCNVTYLYTMRITGSMEYLNEHIQAYPGSYYAGKKAVVELYGPDYPRHPRETKIVGPHGTFTIRYRAHTCAKKGSAGVAMVSVGRFTGMLPTLASTVP